MRPGVLAFTLVGVPAMAHADPPELTGFTGVTYFGAENGLGDSTATEHGPQTSLTLGGRLTLLPGDQTARSTKFGGELELSYTPADVTGTINGKTKSVDSPVVGYRALGLVRFAAHPWIHPHIVLGFGGDSIATSSELVHRDSDLVLVDGVGVSIPMTERLNLRVDARQNWMEQRDGGWGAGYEIHVGVTALLGQPPKSRDAVPVEERHDIAAVNAVAPANADGDHDGIPDAADKCPMDPELMNGIDDTDGCPERDDDGDHILGSDDKCPNEPEDFDQNEDMDGCPDLDDDHDGIPDKQDKCPLQPESKNGIADDDGCPDANVVPPKIVAAFDAAKKIKFESNKARLSEEAKSALDKTSIVLMGNTKLKVVITVHPDKADEAAKSLAQKRADSVRFYLQEQGAAATQLSTKVGDVAPPKKGPQVELSLVN